MESRHLGFIAEASGGELRNANPRNLATGVSTDSRLIKKGELFIALVGDHFDAHQFITEKLGKTASACMVEAARLSGQPASYPQIVVENTRVALGCLAKNYRQSFHPVVIGVTGSNGKTSTKRFLNGVLSQRWNVCASPASFNNDVGVPLSLLQLSKNAQVAVFEVGTNHPGEIPHLTKMIQPLYGVITSIGRSHLEFFGSVEAVAKEKGFLAEALPEDGVLFVNGDIPLLGRILARARSRVVKVGFGKWNDWQVRDWKLDAKGMEFWMRSAPLGVTQKFRVAVLGRHQLVNAGLALAVGAELGLTVGELETGIAQCGAEKMRLEWGEFGGVTLIDDSYNANEDSTIAALDTLRDFPSRGARYCVLGDMSELGAFSAAAHSKIGRAAAHRQVDHIISVGKWSEKVRQTAKENGAQSAEAYASWAAAGESLKNILRSGDIVLVKASRDAGLDRLVEFLKQALLQREHSSEASGNPPRTPVDANRFPAAKASVTEILKFDDPVAIRRASFPSALRSAAEYSRPENMK